MIYSFNQIVYIFLKNLKYVFEPNSVLKFTYEPNIDDKLPFLYVFVDNYNFFSSFLYLKKKQRRNANSCL